MEVSIEGVESNLADDLLVALSIHRQKDNDKLTAASVRTLFERSADEIKSVMNSRGFYHFQLDKNLSSREELWIVQFKIETGEPTLIGKVSIILQGEAESDSELVSAVENFPLSAGEQLNHGLYEEGKKTIQNLANQRGYFEAVWLSRRLDVNTEQKRADINLVFDSGRRYRYDTIVIPDSVILPQLLEKILSIKSGDYYNAGELIRSQQQLQNTNYFEQIIISTGTEDEQSKLIPVDIRLVEKKKNSYRAGFGFGTDTGPRLAGAWDSHYLNKRGHRLENDLRLSFVQSSLSSSYLIPFFRGRENELGINAAVSHEDTDTSISDKFQSGIQHLSSRWGWNETVSLTYQYEDYKVADTSRSSHLLIPGLAYWKSVSDNPVNTRRGFRLSTDLRGSVDGVVSNVSFLQLNLRGKIIFPLGENGRLISRAEVGATMTSSFTRMPSSLRFFAGGDNSIRGFDLETLGPRNTAGEVLGGKYLAVGSIEYEHRVYEKWSVALFSDFGNAFDDFSTDIEYSIGTGIRWQSPVGAIRVDVASGISASDNPIRLHIVIGPDL